MIRPSPTISRFFTESWRRSEDAPKENDNMKEEFDRKAAYILTYGTIIFILNSLLIRLAVNAAMTERMNIVLEITVHFGLIALLYVALSHMNKVFDRQDKLKAIETANTGADLEEDRHDDDCEGED
jgi:hypothetical protein